MLFFTKAFALAACFRMTPSQDSHFMGSYSLRSRGTTGANATVTNLCKIIKF